MVVVQSRSHTWIRGAQRAKVVLIGSRMDDEVIVATKKLHRYGDRRYVSYSEACDDDGRALAFRLVCSPPPPPVRAEGHTCARLSLARTHILAPLEEPQRGKCDVAVFHPYIVVGAVATMELEPLAWCRLEQNRLGGGSTRWVDVVSVDAWPKYRKMVDNHYRQFYERCRAVRRR